MYARSPTATIGEPMQSNTGKRAGRSDETIMETQRFTISNPRFARNVPTVNLLSSAGEVHPQIFKVGQPKNHISDLQFQNSRRLRPSSVGRRVSKQKCVPVLVTLRKLFIESKKWRWSTRCTILGRRGQWEDIDSLTLRCLMRRMLSPWKRSFRIQTSRRWSVWKSRRPNWKNDPRILPGNWRS